MNRLRLATLSVSVVALGATALPTLQSATAAPVPAAHADAPVEWCSEPAASPPCIESATRNAVPVTQVDPEWEVSGMAFDLEGSNHVSINVMRSGSYDIGSDSLDDEWEISVSLGPTPIPRVVSGRAVDVGVTRSEDGGNYFVTVQGTPVAVTGGCSTATWPWTCSSVPTDQWDGYLDFQVTDYNAWDDASQRASFYGMDYFSTIEAISLPPEIVSGATSLDTSLLIRMANTHFYEDGTTVFEGRSLLRIPNRFLKVVYGIDDPASMNGSGLIATISGGSAGAGTVDISQAADGSAMVVDLQGVTFSARALRIKVGAITPTRPGDVQAQRTTADKGKLTFDPSSSRGAKVTGYVAKCTSVKGSHVATGAAKASPVVVSGLKAGTKYDCKVRATSKAGKSKAATVTMARRP